MNRCGSATCRVREVKEYTAIVDSCVAALKVCLCRRHFLEALKSGWRFVG